MSKQNRFWFLVRRTVSMIGAGLLLLFLGVVVTRGPARRETQSPVYLSRASGLAAQTGATNQQLVGDNGISGPFLTTAEPTSFDGDIRHLPAVPAVVQDIKPELQVNETDKSAHVGLKTAPSSRAPVLPSQARSCPGH